jgi:hypothetical protein
MLPEKGGEAFIEKRNRHKECGADQEGMVQDGEHRIVDYGR